MIAPTLPLTLRQMETADLPQVVAIERASFTLPWSEGSFRSDLTSNTAARLVVAEQEGRVIGYVGYWMIVDEAHISTLAVAPDDRRRGIGRTLLRAAWISARAEGAQQMTLEVRASNHAAQDLYRSLGFSEVGRRRRYYQDNLEDAVLMTRSEPRAGSNSGAEEDRAEP